MRVVQKNKSIFILLCLGLLANPVVIFWFAVILGADSFAELVGQNFELTASVHIGIFIIVAAYLSQSWAFYRMSVWCAVAWAICVFVLYTIFLVFSELIIAASIVGGSVKADISFYIEVAFENYTFAIEILICTLIGVAIGGKVRKSRMPTDPAAA